MRISRRAERIEPFYVMEVAKAAAKLAREVARSDRPMIFLNIGEPDFTAPPLVQEAAERAIRAGAHAVHARHRPGPRCANASAAGTASASAWTCRRAASWSRPAPRRRCSWPAWR
jgi:aspartate/methionine/tyrosine aminotransferase